MKQLDALREAMQKPWYRDEMYLEQWMERSGVRYCFLTPNDIIGWGFTWEKAIADADKQFARRGERGQ